MTIKGLLATLMLAVLTAASLNATAMAQGTGNTRVQSTQLTAKATRAPFLNPQSPEDVRFLKALKLMHPYTQWMIGANKTGAVYTSLADGPDSKRYNLKGKGVRKFLQYEKQGTFGGINLGWTDNASAKTATGSSQWYFTKPFGAYSFVRPVVYGERVALAWRRGENQYVKYAKRNVGINLDWSKKPSFEWAILGGKPGTDVKRGEDWVILYNLKHKMPLMYFDRTKGGDIGWPDSTRWGTGSLVLKNNVTMDNAVKALLMPGVWPAG